MRKLIITQWVSLDGIFDSESMDKWWNPFDSPERQQYIQDTINNCEVMLYGRVTYEMLYPYWSSFKDNAMGVADRLNKGKKYVVSSSLQKARWENTTILDENFIKDITVLKQQEGGYILVQGSSSLIKPLLEAGLVDELRLLINPYIVGNGVRPFLNEVKRDIAFLKFQQFDKNVVLLVYKPTDI
ncbi:MAG: dihydrofolate reductase family protein [Taibaiella sp.]|nr:dihydrofolate reductase family protein [Taibaiella sp.]